MASDRVTVVLPNKEIDLGEVEPADHIMVGELDVPVGRDWDAYIRKAKDIPEDEREMWVTWAIRKPCIVIAETRSQGQRTRSASLPRPLRN
jgi:tryptophanyl-tRNA synthetase